MNVTFYNQILQQSNRETLQKYQTDKYNKGVNIWTHLASIDAREDIYSALKVQVS